MIIPAPPAGGPSQGLDSAAFGPLAATQGSFELGALVRIVGLTKHPRLNGVLGRVKEVLQGGLYHLTLPGEGIGSPLYLVKERNLEAAVALWQPNPGVGRLNKAVWRPPPRPKGSLAAAADADAGADHRRAEPARDRSRTRHHFKGSLAAGRRRSRSPASRRP